MLLCPLLRVLLFFGVMVLMSIGRAPSLDPRGTFPFMSRSAFGGELLAHCDEFSCQLGSVTCLAMLSCVCVYMHVKQLLFRRNKNCTLLQDCIWASIIEKKVLSILDAV